MPKLSQLKTERLRNVMEVVIAGKEEVIEIYNPMDDLRNELVQMLLDNEVLLPYITNSYKNKPITASEQIDYLYFKSFLNFVDKLFTFSITDGDSYDISGCPYIICGELLLVDHGKIVNNPSFKDILTATIENNILTIHLLNEDTIEMPLISISFFVNLPPT